MIDSSLVASHDTILDYPESQVCDVCCVLCAVYCVLCAVYCVMCVVWYYMLIQVLLSLFPQGALWDSDDMSMTVTDSLNTVRELVPNGACTSNHV